MTRKGRRWYAVLTVGKDAAGRQVRHWSRGFKTRREAERGLAQLLIDGRQAKETRHTVRQVVSEYIDRDVTRRGKRSPTTTQRYRGLLKNMESIYGDRVDRLPLAMLEAFYLRLLESGLSQTTVHHVHGLLFAAFRWAKGKRIGLITRNPFEEDHFEAPRRAKSNARAFTVEQARRALEFLAHTKHANALIFCLATACRRGEACGLKWDAVDFDRRVAVIRESRYQITGKQGQKPTKAESIREVPLNDTALGALAAERKRRDKRRASAGDAWAETGHVFADELGNALSPMALTNAFYRCAKIAGLPSTRMHDLRHTAATFILSAGANPAAATEILGHSERGTTLRIYGHVIDLDSVRAARTIDRALRRKPL